MCKCSDVCENFERNEKEDTYESEDKITDSEW